MEYNIILPKQPKIIKKGNNHSMFEIDGCYPGYGMTLGNVFRRVLLSSLPGSAITTVRIKGASHEFSTLPNVLEDVIHIILNLKKIRFKINSEEFLPIKVSLKVNGEKKITSKNIKTGPEIEVINKEIHIATLTSKTAKLEMEIEVDKGLGYVVAEQKGKDKLAIGTIAVDSIFSPIERVNYEVQNMRVGDRTDFNRLRLDIETDGSITPEEAFNKAVNILIDHFKIFIKGKKKKVVKKAIKKVVGKK